MVTSRPPRPQFLSRSGQAVAQAADGLDPVGADLLAQPADEHLDGVGVTVEVLVVEMLDQLGAADHPALMHHQIVKQAVLQRGEAQRFAVDAGAGRSRVETQAAERQARRSMSGRAAQKRPQPRQQLLGVERLGQVVVGAGVEPGDLFAPGAARGQDQHRHGHALAPPALQHRHAVDLGQAEIQDHRVVGFGLAQELGLLAVCRMVHRIAGVAERRLELARQVRIVLDQ